MSTPPLAGLVVDERGGAPAVAVAGWFLDALGALVRRSAPAQGPFAERSTRGGAGSAGRPGRAHVALAARPSAAGPGPAAWLADDGGPPAVAGLPPGALHLATGYALAAAALAAALGATRLEVSAREVAAQVLLPPLMAAAYGAPPPAAPAPPLVSGDGQAWADLGADGDAEAFDRLLASMGPGPHAATAVAAEAQVWRLPVVDVRRRPRPPEPDADPSPVVHGVGWAEPGPPHADAAADRWDAAPADALGPRRPGEPPLAGVVVVDLTVMWAGPLATWLLGALGAEVRKVEPACRLDGLRGLDGRGTTPGGDGDPGRGDRSALFNALNRGKARLDLDLRRPSDHAALLAQVAGADLVVDAFSPRVHEQLGTGRDALAAARPDVATLSMPAFPPGDPRRSWVAYGGGVHAASGLADLGGGAVAVPVVSYPDPLAGLAGAAAALALLVGRRLGWAPTAAEVPILSATLPLRRWPADPAAWAGPLGVAPVDDVGVALLADPSLMRRGALRPLTDGAGTHPYPRAPFVGPGVPVDDRPAPALPGSVAA